MALTIPEALKTVQNRWVQGIGKAIVTMDAFSAMIPIQPVDGDSFKSWREGTLPVGGAFVDDAGATTEESTGTSDQVDIHMRRIVGNMDIDKLADVVNSGQEKGDQLAKKVKATWRRVQQTMITGNRVTSHTMAPVVANPFSALSAPNYGPWLDSTRRGPGSLKYVNGTTSWYFRAPGDYTFGDPVVAAGNGTYTLFSHNRSKWIQFTITVASATADGECGIYFNSTTNEFEGLNEIVSPSRIIDPVGAAGDAFNFSLLDQLMTNEKVRQNRAFILNSSIEEKIYAAYRSMGGMEPRMTQVPGYTGQDVLSYRGIPILVNDFVLSNETVGATSNATSIYLASMTYEDGLFLGAGSYGGQQALVNVDPYKRAALGFYFTNVGPLEAKDAERTRVGFIGALGLRSELALVRKRGVQTV